MTDVDELTTLSLPPSFSTGPVISPEPSLPDSLLDPTNSTTAVQPLPLFPIAAIIVIVLVVFVSTIATLLLIRKVLKNKGITGGNCLSECPMQLCSGNVLPSCRLKCLEMAERMDCSIPNCHVWLDNVCPTKQQCSMTCSKIWSCYCCFLLSGACEDVQICPNCSAMECPDCSCCGDCCHCTLKIPECSQVTCLCFECGKS